MLSRSPSLAALVTALCAGTGCGDIAIGTFPLTQDSEEGGASGDGESGVALPGGCVDEAFDGLESQRWVTWADADADVTADGGMLTLVPATSSGAATGLVLDNSNAFPFDAAHVRVEVLTPPDPTTESELFLQVTQQVPPTDAVLSIALYQGTVRVTVAGDDGAPMMTGPVATEYPRWIGIRTDGGVVSFETSSDGTAWTTGSTADQPAAFSGATPLVMVWNNASDTAIDAQPVVVDNMTICAQ